MKLKHFHIRIDRAYLLQDEEALNSFMQSVRVINTTSHLISSEKGNYWSILVFYRADQPSERYHENYSEKKPTFDPDSLNADEKKRYEALRTWRAGAADSQNIAPFIVAHNSQLGSIAKLNPSSTKELSLVKGFNEKKIGKYGEEIIAVINSI